MRILLAVLIIGILFAFGIPEDGIRALAQPKGDRMRYFHYLQAYRFYGFEYAIQKYGVEPKQ